MIVAQGRDRCAQIVPAGLDDPLRRCRRGPHAGHLPGHLG